MTFFARPDLSDIQFKQLKESYLTLSGTTRIGNLQLLGDDFNFIPLHVNVTGETEGYVLTFRDGVLHLEESSVYNLASPSTMSVGGIDVGTTLTGKTANQILRDMLAPTIFPTYVSPNNTFVKLSPSGTLFEIGLVNDFAFTSTFNRGEILLNNAFQNNRSGAPTSHNYEGVGLPASNLTNENVDSQTSNDYEVSGGTQLWRGRVYYDVGPQPLDSDGNPFEAPLSSGNTSWKNVIIEGVYPIYATSSNITTLTKQSLISMVDGNNIELILVMEDGANKQKFDMPDDWLTARPLIGIRTLNVFSDTWEYQGGNATNSLIYWDSTSTTHTIQGNSVDYTRFAYNGVNRGGVQIKLEF